MPRITKKIPIDRVADIQIIEPAGDCLPPNMLYTVMVQTAAKSQEGAELVITGLSESDVYDFRNMVMGRKKVTLNRMQRGL